MSQSPVPINPRRPEQEPFPISVTLPNPASRLDGAAVSLPPATSHTDASLVQTPPRTESVVQAASTPDVPPPHAAATEPQLPTPSGDVDRTPAHEVTVYRAVAAVSPDPRRPIHADVPATDATDNEATAPIDLTEMFRPTPEEEIIFSEPVMPIDHDFVPEPKLVDPDAEVAFMGFPHDSGPEVTPSGPVLPPAFTQALYASDVVIREGTGREILGTYEAAAIDYANYTGRPVIYLEKGVDQVQDLIESGMPRDVALITNVIPSLGHALTLTDEPRSDYLDMLVTRLQNQSQVYAELPTGELRTYLDTWSANLEQAIERGDDLNVASLLLLFESARREARMFSPEAVEQTRNIRGKKLIIMGIGHEPMAEEAFQGSPAQPAPTWQEFLDGLDPEEATTLTTFLPIARVGLTTVTPEEISTREITRPQTSELQNLWSQAGEIFGPHQFDVRDDQRSAIALFQQAIPGTYTTIPELVEQHTQEVLTILNSPQRIRNANITPVELSLLAAVTIPEEGYTGGKVPTLRNETPEHRIFRLAIGRLRNFAEGSKGFSIPELRTEIQRLQQLSKRRFDEVDQAGVDAYLTAGRQFLFIRELLAGFERGVVTAASARRELQPESTIEVINAPWLQLFPPEPTGATSTILERQTPQPRVEGPLNENVRFRHLADLVRLWNQGGTPPPPELTATIWESTFHPKGDPYYVAVLPQRLEDGTIIEHAVFDSPRDENAAFARRGERQQEDGLTWAQAMNHRFKSEAARHGARRFLHQGDWESAIMNYLTLPPDELEPYSPS